MKKKIAAYLIGLTLAVGSGVVVGQTSHTSSRVPASKAQNTFHGEGCLETKVVQSQLLVLNRKDTDTFTMSGEVLEVRCLRWGVVAGPFKGAKLSWTRPTSRENGDPLVIGELLGYEITYTSDTGSRVVISIEDPNITSYQIGNLGEGGVYHFFIKSEDTEGLKSAPSEEITMTMVE